jgi:CelD/BcsL family acetyltransferase involved in cellulose biosynthesis
MSTSTSPEWRLFPIAEFPAHAGAWRALNVATADSPALDPDFVAPLLDHFGNPRARLCIAGEPREPAAMTIAVPSRLAVWQTLQPAQAPIGLWLARQAFATDCLGAALLRKLPGTPLLFGLSQLDPEIVPANMSGGPHLQILDYIQTGRITVNGSFDDYWAARGKNLRHNLKRQTNRMATDGLMGQLDVLTEAGEMAAAVDEYGRLENAGWKASGGTAIAPDNTQGRFYRAMLERFAARGAARVFRYRLGEKTAAVDLCIEQGGTLIILKTTYDESINGYSPAMLMRQEALRHIFADGRVRRIEFYGKVMDWHTKWTKEIRMMYHLNCYRFGFLARLLGLRRTALRDAPAGANAA